MILGIEKNLQLTVSYLVWCSRNRMGRFLGKRFLGFSTTKMTTLAWKEGVNKFL